MPRLASGVVDIARARGKLRAKRLDLIVANGPDAFAAATAKVTIIDSGGGVKKLPELSKEEVAERILDRVAALAAGRKGK